MRARGREREQGRASASKREGESMYVCVCVRERESTREKRAVSNYFGHASNLCSATTAQPRATAIQIWSSCRTNLQPERLATNPHRDSYMLTIRQPGDEIGGYESAPPSHQGGSSVHSTPSELASGAHESGTACEPHPQGRGTERTNPSCRGRSPGHALIWGIKTQTLKAS